MKPTSNAFLLLLLTAIVGLVGLLFVVWILQAWRRNLQRGTPKPPGGPGADTWQTAGQRLELDDVEGDDRN